MTVQRLTLHEPPSANRWWRNVNGRMVTSKMARLYKQAAGLSALCQGVKPIVGPLSLTVVWYRGRKSGDLDKRLGVLLDALQGAAYANDSQIVELHATRSDADPKNPRVEVTLTPL
jgi:Holliday junction resolvase RusA-like endonuclease